MKLYFTFLTIFCCFTLSTVSNAQVIVNANIIRGENFVTPKLSEKEVNNVVERALKKRGFNILQKMDSLSNILVVETYLYQYPGQFPTIVLLARSKDGVHYINGDSIKFFFTPSDGFFKLLDRLVNSLPRSFDPQVNYPVDINSIFSNSNTSITTISSNAINSTIQKNGQVVISVLEADLTDFYLEEIFPYLILSTNLSTIRSKLYTKPISLYLKYDEKGKFVINEIDSPFELNPRQKAKLNDFVRAIPTWIDASNPNAVIEIYRKRK